MNVIQKYINPVRPRLVGMSYKGWYIDRDTGQTRSVSIYPSGYGFTPGGGIVNCIGIDESRKDFNDHVYGWTNVWFDNH